MLLFLLLLEKFNRLDLAVLWLYCLLLSNHRRPRLLSEELEQSANGDFLHCPRAPAVQLGCNAGKVVFVSSGTVTQCHRPVACKQEECPSHHSWRLESLRSGLWQIWVWRDPISWLISSLLSPCPHGVEAGKRARWDFFCKGTNSTCKDPTSWPPHLPKPPSPSTNARMRFQHVSLGRYSQLAYRKGIGALLGLLNFFVPSSMKTSLALKSIFVF